MELHRTFRADWFGVETNQFQQLLAIDRLVHHSVILEFNRKSHRLDEAEQRQRAEDRQGQDAADIDHEE